MIELLKIDLILLHIFFFFSLKKKKKKKPQAVSGLPYPVQAVRFIIQSKEKLSASGQ